jgi:hypothetical protein
MAINQEILVFISTVATAVSSIGTLTAAICAAKSAYYSRKSLDATVKIEREKKEDLFTHDLNRIIEIGIEYPYLESRPFTDEWVKFMHTSDEKYLRYDMFCNLIFNYLSQLYDYCDGDKKKIEEFVDVKSWVRLHKYNWHNPVDPNENIDAYSEKFRQFINSYITI